MSTAPAPDPDPAAATAGGGAAPVKEKSDSREYLILESTQQGVWREVKSVTASTQEGALKSLGEDALKETTHYVAVPKRNWQPVKPKVKKTTTISFGG